MAGVIINLPENHRSGTFSAKAVFVNIVDFERSFPSTSKCALMVSHFGNPKPSAIDSLFDAEHLRAAESGATDQQGCNAMPSVTSALNLFNEVTSRLHRLWEP